ncbi:MAG: magnesium chelatase [Candidatus Woykebacteria bacterium RBG_16_43_9]|uniref:Magnesium chelatase n=1 Tax=Candidatus Woykebacteria bacterium RBG_16_43_9 TaxID=1802596 RepID=A0A1G1WBR3_9BACT|nr:MAG: magnesium chelatase [Candidatus Woykebacteria bacterium RBG_16_43_9]
MLSKVISGATVGLDSVPIEVEVDIAAQGLPAFTIVGLPDKAVEESKERVRAALKNVGAEFPSKRITVNLAPADMPKEGPAYDLPIAIGILIASGQLSADLADSLFVGELSLDGNLRATSGILSFALLAKEKNFKRIIIPSINAKEAAVVEGISVIGVENVIDLFHHLSGNKKIAPQPKVKLDLETKADSEFDMKEIRGQETAKRALEIAAAGGHNTLLKGPPGAGKTLLARAFPSILPRLTLEEALEVTKIYSILGLVNPADPVMKTRPFRSPHHSASAIGLIGGGTHPKPGEISLANRGVLFLDEFPEFPRHVLESLRGPLEDGVVTVSRASASLSFPANFTLIAAANPCPCGFLGDETKECNCLPGQIVRYQKRLSGPILDRIDLHVDVPAVKVDRLTGDTEGEPSENIRNRVQRAKEIQLKRFSGASISGNSEMGPKSIKIFCKLSPDCLDLLRAAVSRMQLSARGYHRVLKVARTIADLEGSKEIDTTHIAEALQYRSKAES